MAAGVDVAALALAERALVPVEPEPGEARRISASLSGVERSRSVSSSAQHEGAAGVPGDEPVEEGRSGRRPHGGCRSGSGRSARAPVRSPRVCRVATTRRIVGVRFGAHVSSSGGISKAIGRGRDLGCESLQVFTHNPRTWRPINHSDEEIAAFRAQARRGRDRADREPRPLPHQPRRARPRGAERAPGQAGHDDAQHLPLLRGEPGAAPRGRRARSGLAGVVLHVGLVKGSSEDEAIARIGAGIAEALRRRRRATARVFLENTAGAGRHHRPHLRPAPRGGRRGGRARAARLLPRLPAPVRLRLPRPRAGRHRPGAGRVRRRRSASSACAACT